MESIEINIGDILHEVEADTFYRIIFIKEEMVVMCQMECSTMSIVVRPYAEILKCIIEKNVDIEHEEKAVVNHDAISEAQHEALNTRMAMMNDVAKAYGPDYIGLCGKAHKVAFNQIANQYHMTTKTLWKIVRRYLQTGFDPNSLLDMRSQNGGAGASVTTKVGRKCKNGIRAGVPLTREVQAQFEEALALFKSGRAKTYAFAYDALVMTHYSVMEQTTSGLVNSLKPLSERPTFNQFYSYCRKHLTAEEHDKIKTSAREQRNDKRLLLSDNLHDVFGPGDCFEMDEVEVDLSLKSLDGSGNTVGRPIVYVMIDVYTRMIMAASVSFDNNSVLAMTNCFLNLAEDKVELCKKHGLIIPKEIWPSGILPKRIRCDRGAEYRSKQMVRICNELGITRELVPAATGSLKGSVEQIFHQMHAAQNPMVENLGLIEKRHDSAHHQEAMLDIDDFRKIILNFIITYNQHYYKNYPMTKDMRSKGVKPTPIELWKYGIKKHGAPQPIPNINQYLFTLMKPITAKLSRKGIMIDGLYYINTNDKLLLSEMYKAQNKRVPFEVRMDERDVGAVYYLRDKNMVKAKLNESRVGNAEYAGMTRAEYLRVLEEKHRTDKIGAEQNMQLRVARNALYLQTIKNAESKPRKTITAARQVERNKVESDLKVVPDVPTSSNAITAPNGVESEKSISLSTPVDWEELMEDFN